VIEKPALSLQAVVLTRRQLVSTHCFGLVSAVGEIKRGAKVFE